MQIISNFFICFLVKVFNSDDDLSKSYSFDNSIVRQFEVDILLLNYDKKLLIKVIANDDIWM